jgi:hypothetical protein
LEKWGRLLRGVFFCSVFKSDVRFRRWNLAGKCRVINLRNLCFVFGRLGAGISFLWNVGRFLFVLGVAGRIVVSRSVQWRVRQWS